jgi:hypothetical protein
VKKVTAFVGSPRKKHTHDAVLARQSEKFHATLLRAALPAPSLFKLMIFRMSRTSLKLILDDSYRDYRYYADHGWFESGYYYPVRLNPLQKAAGSLFDSMAARSARRRDR